MTPEIPDFDAFLQERIPATVSFNTRDQKFVAGHEFVYAENGTQYVMTVTSVTRTKADWGVLTVVARYKKTLAAVDPSATHSGTPTPRV